MIRDWLGECALVLLQGPILLLLALVAGLLLVGFGYGWGRRSAFREVDEGRAAVREACEDAAAERLAGMVPGQRDGEK